MTQTDQEHLSPAFRYTATVTLAAAEWAAYAPASLATVYASDTEAAARAWGLHPAEAGANTLLAEPPWEVMLERTWMNDAGVRIAAPSQAVVDLLTGSGHNPAEAEKLLTWMERNEGAWRNRG